MRLAIVILNYRTPDLTIDCLASLQGQVAIGLDQVIVVDNASGDDSADRIESTLRARGWQDWASVRRSATNGGFAAGNNLAIRETDAQWYLLLNSDTIVRPKTVAALLTAGQQRPEAGLLGPSFEQAQGQWSASCFRDYHPISELLDAARTGPLTRLLQGYEIHLKASDAPLEVDWIGFACVLIRREVIQQIGLLDEGFFMYFEDADYCRRARAAGWRIVYLPDLRVLHLLGASSDVNHHHTDLRRRPRYYYAARTRYYRKHYGRWGLASANLLWTLGRALSWTREAVRQKQPHTRAHEWRDIWTDCFRRFCG